MGLRAGVPDDPYTIVTFAGYRTGGVGYPVAVKPALAPARPAGIMEAATATPPDPAQRSETWPEPDASG